MGWLLQMLTNITAFDLRLAVVGTNTSRPCDVLIDTHMAREVYSVCINASSQSQTFYDYHFYISQYG